MKSRLYFLILLFFFALITMDTKSQSWRDLGAGTLGSIDNMYFDSTTNLLFVVGNFQFAGGQLANQIAIWDSVNWSSFGNNERFKRPGSLDAIAKFNGEIVVGGTFDSVGNQAISNVARWNGSNWVPLADGLNGTVVSLVEYNGCLYAGGYFNQSGNVAMNHLAKWDGVSWSMVGGGFDDFVLALGTYHNSLVIGGGFSNAGIVHVNGIASWNDTVISALGAGFGYSVYRIRTIQDTLYATGSFTAWSGNPSNYISKWDGTTWLPMPYPTGGQHSVVDITMFDSSLYVCGYFSNPPDLVVLHGNQYDSVGDCYGFIKTLQIYKNELYVAGGFSSINGVSFNNIARLNSINTLEINKVSDETRIAVSPNPTSLYSIHLSLSNTELNAVEKAELYSLEGKFITKFEIDQEYLFPQYMSKNLEGVYLLKIIVSKKVYVLKLILLP